MPKTARSKKRSEKENRPGRLLSALLLQPDPASWRRALTLILLAYLAAVAIRLAFPLGGNQGDAYYWHGRPMICSTDGYFYAEGVRDILAGSHQPGDLSPVTEALPVLTAGLLRLLPLDFAWTAWYLPVLLGSLIVVPLILTGRALAQIRAGFLAALLAAVAPSYYNRTMTGYFDTDMLVLVFFLMLVYSLLAALLGKHDSHLPLIAIFASLFQWWYPQGLLLPLALLATALGYVVLYARREVRGWQALIFLTLGLSTAPYFLNLAAALALYFLWKTDLLPAKRSIRAAGAVAFFALLAYLATAGSAALLRPLSFFILKDDPAAGLKFLPAAATIRETRELSLTLFAQRVIGPLPVFVLAVAGFGLLAWKRPVCWLWLPLAGLGAASFIGGLRFTFFLVPVAALGLAVFIVQLAGLLPGGAPRLAGLAVLAAASLAPNLVQAANHRDRPLLDRDEVAVLDRLKGIAGREDIAVAWWDFGYPIRYYADVKTLIDGYYNTGDVNFPVAFVLTETDPVAARNMALLAAGQARQAGGGFGRLLAGKMASNPGEFLNDLKNPLYPLPSRDHDTYLVLPAKTLPMFGQITRFADIDLRTGAIPYPIRYVFSRTYQKEKDAITFSPSLRIDTRANLVHSSTGESPLKAVWAVDDDPRAGRRARQLYANPDGELSLLMLTGEKALVLLDDRLLATQFIQLFVFERYDPRCFEPVILDPKMKVYLIKR